MKNQKMQYFVDKLKEMYPELTERQIKKTINIGCHNIANMLRREENINIECGPSGLKFVIHRFGEKPTLPDNGTQPIPRKYIN